MTFFLLLCFIIITNLNSSVSEIDVPIIDIPDVGKISGASVTTAWTSQVYYKYNGIKYAEAPVNENRYSPPIPANKFTEDHDGAYYGYPCPSFDNMPLEGLKEIDIVHCLTLAIHTKNISASQPVLIYLPGYDLFSGGNYEINGKYLLEKDVVLASVQYRVGPLGFLSTLTKEIPGNAGVLDVILALKWIQKYISCFGGDPNRVTLFGQYKAASLINILTMTPLAEGLFNQVIYQSGTGLLSNVTLIDPLEFSQDIAMKIGCSIHGAIEEINECLQEKPLSEIYLAYKEIWEQNEGHVGYFTVSGPSEVLEDTPEGLMKSEKYRSYPTIAGVVQNPSTVLLDKFEGEFAIFSPAALAEKFGEVINSTIYEHQHRLAGRDFYNTDNILSFFPVDLAVRGFFDAVMPGIMDFTSFGLKSTILDTLRYNKEKSYLYAFNYHGEHHHFSKKPGHIINDISLLDDTLYLWMQKDLNPSDTKIAKKFVDLFTSFAAYGIPKTESLYEWPAFKNNGPYLNIKKKLLIEVDFTKEYYSTVQKHREKFCNNWN